MDNIHVITSVRFQKALDGALAKHGGELLKCWNKKSSDYTKVWEGKKSGGGIYRSLAENLGMKYVPEYCRMDAMLCPEYCPHTYGGDSAPAFLSVAIEHENDFSSSAQEINKLLATNAPMKVLITYPWKNEKALLGEYARQIRAVDDIWSDYSARQAHVVVFGYKKGGKLEWKYYAYDGGAFLPAGYIIEPRQFKRAMADALQTHGEELLSFWENPRKYDAVMERKGGNGGVYQTTAANLGMKWLSHYWRLEAVYFRDYCPLAYGGEYKASFLSAAVEHEHYAATSHQEINRLLVACSPLKVLITYPERRGAAALLVKFAGQIKTVEDARPGYSARQKHVVVFVYKTGKKLKWDFHLYENGKFRPL